MPSTNSKKGDRTPPGSSGKKSKDSAKAGKSPDPKPEATASSRSTHRLTKEDLLSESDLDARLLDSAGSGEIDVGAPDDAPLVLPEDEGGEPEIVVPDAGKSAKKSGKLIPKKSGKASKPAVEAASEDAAELPAEDTATSQSSDDKTSKKSKKAGATSKRRPAPAAGGKKSPMMFVALGAGLVILVLVGIIIYKLTTVNHSDHEAEHLKAKKHYEEATKLVKDMKTAQGADSDSLRQKAIKKLREGIAVYQKLRDKPNYGQPISEDDGGEKSKVDSDGLAYVVDDAGAFVLKDGEKILADREFKKEFKFLEQELGEMQKLLGQLAKDTKIDQGGGEAPEPSPEGEGGGGDSEE